MFRKLHLHTGEFAKLGTLIELPTEYFVTKSQEFKTKKKKQSSKISIYGEGS